MITPTILRYRSTGVSESAQSSPFLSGDVVPLPIRTEQALKARLKTQTKHQDLKLCLLSGDLDSVICVAAWLKWHPLFWAFEYLVSSWWCSLGRYRRCALVGRVFHWRRASRVWRLWKLEYAFCLQFEIHALSPPACLLPCFAPVIVIDS